MTVVMRTSRRRGWSTGPNPVSRCDPSRPRLLRRWQPFQIVGAGMATCNGPCVSPSVSRSVLILDAAAVKS